MCREREKERDERHVPCALLLCDRKRELLKRVEKRRRREKERGRREDDDDGGSSGGKARGVGTLTMRNGRPYSSNARDMMNDFETRKATQKFL